MTRARRRGVGILVGALVAVGLAWLLFFRRKTPAAPKAVVSIGDTFSVGGTTYPTPAGVKTPETGDPCGQGQDAYFVGRTIVPCPA